MIFQYCTSVSELDSKRHYVWKCVSEEDPAIWIFLTPNGNRFAEMADCYILPNSVTIHQLMLQMDREILFREECERLLKKYPMIGKARVVPASHSDHIRIADPFRYAENNRGSEEIEHAILLVLLNELQGDIVTIERQMFEHDARLQHQRAQIQTMTELSQLAGRLDMVSWVDAFAKLSTNEKVPPASRPVILLNAATKPTVSLKRDRDVPFHSSHSKKPKFC